MRLKNLVKDESGLAAIGSITGGLIPVVAGCCGNILPFGCGCIGNMSPLFCVSWCYHGIISVLLGGLGAIGGLFGDGLAILSTGAGQMAKEFR